MKQTTIRVDKTVSNNIKLIQRSLNEYKSMSDIISESIHMYTRENNMINCFDGYISKGDTIEFLNKNNRKYTGDKVAVLKIIEESRYEKYVLLSDRTYINAGALWDCRIIEKKGNKKWKTRVPDSGPSEEMYNDMDAEFEAGDNND